MASQTFNDSQIDRSVGTVLLLVIVCGAFLLIVAGMASLRQNAEKVTETPSGETVEQPVYDIGT